MTLMLTILISQAKNIPLELFFARDYDSSSSQFPSEHFYPLILEMRLLKSNNGKMELPLPLVKSFHLLGTGPLKFHDKQFILKLYILESIASSSWQ